MTHLVNNLSNYMMFEVVEAAWPRLEEQLAASICLDEVIAAHDKYLADIEDRALLSAKHEAINMQASTIDECKVDLTILDSDGYALNSKVLSFGGNTGGGCSVCGCT